MSQSGLQIHILHQPGLQNGIYGTLVDDVFCSRYCHRGVTFDNLRLHHRRLIEPVRLRLAALCGQVHPPQGHHKAQGQGHSQGAFQRGAADLPQHIPAGYSHAGPPSPGQPLEGIGLHLPGWHVFHQARLPRLRHFSWLLLQLPWLLRCLFPLLPPSCCTLQQLQGRTAGQAARPNGHKGHQQRPDAGTNSHQIQTGQLHRYLHALRPGNRGQGFRRLPHGVAPGWYAACRNPQQPQKGNGTQKAPGRWPIGHAHRPQNGKIPPPQQQIEEGRQHQPQQQHPGENRRAEGG